MQLSNSSPVVLAALACCTLGACNLADVLGGKKTSPSQPISSTAQNTTAPNGSSATAQQPAGSNTAPAKSTRSDGRVFASPEQFDAYQALVKEHPVLQLLANLKEDRIRLSWEPAEAAAEIQTLAPQLEAVQSFAAECEAYRDVVVMNLQAWQEPRVACDTALLGKGATKKLARLAANRYVKGQSKALLAKISSLAGGYSPTDQFVKILFAMNPQADRLRVVKAVAPLATIIGGNFDVSEEIPDIGELRKSALAKGMTVTPGRLYPLKASASIAKVAKARIKKSKPSAKIIKILAKTNKWFIAKKSNGIPSHRGQAVQVITKTKGDGFCRLYSLEADQSYAGGGHYQKSVTMTFTNGFHILKCP